MPVLQMEVMHLETLKSYFSRCALALIFSVTVAGDIGAAEEPIEEIIVTVQKREQLLSDVPLAVSAFSGEQLSERLYTTLEDFKGVVPNMTVNNYAGSTRINIRGVGQPAFSPGAEAATALHMNGVYLSRTHEGSGAFMDLERVEILRGPQGTLYGRNATGGSVNLITNKPSDEFEASAALTYGNYDELRVRGVVSGALSKEGQLLGRVAFLHEEHDGYSMNLFDGKHYDDSNTESVRGTLVFNATDDLTITVVGDYHWEDDGNYATHLLGQGVPGMPLTGVLVDGPGASVPLKATGAAVNPRDLNVDSTPTNDREIGGVSLEITWNINDALTAKSITAYRTSSYTWTSDFDATSASFPSNNPNFNYVQGEDAEQISEEFQLIGNMDRLDWLLGLYYIHEELEPALFDFGFYPAATPFGLLAVGDASIDAYAVFGQATYKWNDRLNLTAGVRYNYEDRSVDENWTTSGFLLGFFGPCLDLPNLMCEHKESESFDEFMPKFSIDYQWTDELMTYATIGKGFKSGGFSVGDLKPAFDPEKIWAYEAGLKFRSSDDRWSADMSGFYYDYSDLQITQIIDGFLSTVNAATSEVHGIEVEVSAMLIPGLIVTNAFSYLDARYEEFMIDDPAFPELGIQDLNGNTLQFAPDFSNNLTLNYEFPVANYLMNLFFEWNWRDKIYFTEFNLDNASQPSESIFNAAGRISASDKRWYIEFWGKNLSDELVVSQGFISSGVLGRPRNGQLDPPRTYGLTIGYEL